MCVLVISYLVRYTSTSVSIQTPSISTNTNTTCQWQRSQAPRSGPSAPRRERPFPIFVTAAKRSSTTATTTSAIHATPHRTRHSLYRSCLYNVMYVVRFIHTTVGARTQSVFDREPHRVNIEQDVCLRPLYGSSTSARTEQHRKTMSNGSSVGANVRPKWFAD